MTTPDILQALRRRRPLVHCVSNQVSANDCANLLLALGASPIMARAPEEAERNRQSVGKALTQKCV